VSDPRTRLPAIGRLIGEPRATELIARFGRAQVVEALRRTVDEARRGAPLDDPFAAARAILERSTRGTLVPAINASGVLLHTNLGRATLPRAALDAIAASGAGACSLELDLETGARGSRHVHASERLRRLSGADAAIVTNNAAAALLLALSALARVVIVSRGELVEIGGGFRIPEIVTSGGARLVEVGTTNRTRVEDYARALDAAPEAVLLKVHRSNFAIVGFTEEVAIEELARLAHERGTRVIHDLGSGLLVRGSAIGLPDEPDVGSAVAAGADVVIFSGDKLLGGPQAGIAVGAEPAIAAMRRHPLMRALRAGKLVLAALDATLSIYEREAHGEIPLLAFLAEDPSSIERRALRLCERVGRGEIVATTARVGAGAQPTRALPSFALRLDGDAVGLAARLREGSPIVVGRIEDDALLLDLRAVGDDDVELLAARVSAALA
jgi:L-seryl-tRNA(Ser) seleniumtransferase